MAKHPKILFVDAHIDHSVQWGTEALRKTIPDAEIVFFDPGQKTTLWGQWRELWKKRSGGYDFSILPTKAEFLRIPSFWRTLLLLVAGSVGSPMLLSQYGTTASVKSLILQRLIPLHPLVSLIIILRLPLYIVRQVIGNFLLAREDPEDEFVGFGKGKDVGGLVYWLTLTRKASRFGLFGFDHNTYMGWPLSVHSWPLAILALKKLGYRKYTYLAAGLLSLGVAWLCISSGHLRMLWVIPFALCSTYFTFSVYVSTWEILAWGFGSVAWAAMYAHMPVLSGVLLAAVILTHPGVGALMGLSVTLYAILHLYPVGDLVWVVGMTGALVFWWVVPYWRSRDKLGRAYVMNKLWLVSKRWHPTTLYQLIIYSLFVIAGLVSDHRNADLWIVLIPLLALYYNVKISFNYSRYTLCNFMLLTGAFYLCLHPSLLAFLVFLLVIYTSGNLLFGADCIWGFDLAPVRLGEQRRKILQFFSRLSPGRAALEMGGAGSQPAWLIIGALGYILADQDIDVLNLGYTEVGDHRIYEKYCRYFNSQATSEEFETACRESGTKYMIALTDEFCEKLIERGYKKIDVLDGVHLSETPGAIQVPLRMTAFELPFPSSVIWPPPQGLQVSRNKIEFTPQAGVSYRVKYSAFQGWRAFQKGRRLKIVDARPGMMVSSASDDKIILQYSYSYYWPFFGKG